MAHDFLRDRHSETVITTTGTAGAKASRSRERYSARSVARVRCEMKNSADNLYKKLENSLVRTNMRQRAQWSYWIGNVVAVVAFLTFLLWGENDYWRLMSIWIGVISAGFASSGRQELQLIDLYEVLTNKQVYDSKEAK